MKRSSNLSELLFMSFGVFRLYVRAYTHVHTYPQTGLQTQIFARTRRHIPTNWFTSTFFRVLNRLRNRETVARISAETKVVNANITAVTSRFEGIQSKIDGKFVS
jgi:hypothetical protein